MGMGWEPGPSQGSEPSQVRILGPKQSSRKEGGEELGDQESKKLISMGRIEVGCVSVPPGLFLGLGGGVKPQKPDGAKDPVLLSPPIPVLVCSQVLPKSTSHTIVFLHWQWPEGPARWE